MPGRLDPEHCTDRPSSLDRTPQHRRVHGDRSFGSQLIRQQGGQPSRLFMAAFRQSAAALPTTDNTLDRVDRLPVANENQARLHRAMMQQLRPSVGPVRHRYWDLKLVPVVR